MNRRIAWAAIFGCYICGAEGVAHGATAKFTPAENCGACHEEIYRQWQTSAHSQAAVDPVFWRFFERAAQERKDLSAGACLTCHSPVGSVNKEFHTTGAVAFPVNLSSLAKEGVTCDFCHTIPGGEYFGKNIGPGVYRYGHPGDTAVKQGTHADAVTPEHATAVSKFLKDPEFCGICHKFTHPVSDVVWQDTYAEWKAGPYAREGRTCQDCHMPEYTGQSATNAPTRADLSAHVFPGSRSDMIKKAASVALWAGVKQTGASRSLSVKALVTNSGSGHLMPTGLPGIRQMWVEVEVKKAATGPVEKHREDFAIEILGGDGKPTMPWNAVRFGKDTRIAPRKSREVAFNLPYASPAAEPIELKATVYYRLISDLAARTAGIPASQPVEIATDRLRVLPDGRLERLPAI